MLRWFSVRRCLVQCLQLSIPDNELTAGFDAKLRKSLLETMLVECLRFKTRETPIVLVLEDCHWLDPLSYDLLEEIGRSIEGMPVLIILTFRDVEMETERTAAVSAMPYYTAMELSPLTQEDLTLLAKLRLERLSENDRDEQTTEILARRIAQQADGNPFYLEELVNYLSSETGGRIDPNELSNVDLPTSLQGLVLSRLDQLSGTAEDAAQGSQCCWSCIPCFLAGGDLP